MQDEVGYDGTASFGSSLRPSKRPKLSEERNAGEGDDSGESKWRATTIVSSIQRLENEVVVGGGQASAAVHRICRLSRDAWRHWQFQLQLSYSINTNIRTDVCRSFWYQLALLLLAFFVTLILSLMRYSFVVDVVHNLFHQLTPSFIWTERVLILCTCLWAKAFDALSLARQIV